MQCSLNFRPFTLPLAAVALLGLSACDQEPVTPEDPSLNALGRDDGTVTVPIEIRFEGGTFVVVPFGDPRIPRGTPTDDCPVGEANPELGLPAGFPNGGGVVVAHATGQARHLGEFEVTQTRCAAQFYPPTDPPFVNFDLRATFTAADGSQLFIRAEFALTPFTPPEVPRPLLEIAGGTGRFEGATGWVTPTRDGQVTCTDASGFCLEGIAEGGFSQGELTIPRP